MGEIYISKKTTNSVDKLLQDLTQHGYDPYIDGHGCSWYIYY